MNKEAFLAKLREYLGILEDREQDDILEEYAQHIDMKMQKGLSEEEAICDFGPMEELVAQILEAYHVKPQFSEKEKSISFLKPKFKIESADAKDGGTSAKKALDWLKEKMAAIAHSIRNAFLWMGRKCRIFGGWLAKPFRQEKPEMNADGSENRITERGTNEMGKQINGCFSAMGKGMVSLWRYLCAFCLWFLKLLWNLAWLMFSLLCAFMAMIALMGFGTLLILLFQGYPFFGIFLISLGGILCFGALSCGAFSLLIREKEEKNGKSEETIGKEIEEAEKSDEEVQYE